MAKAAYDQEVNAKKAEAELAYELQVREWSQWFKIMEMFIGFKQFHSVNE